MREISCILVLWCLACAIDMGRPMGDAPELYYLYNGETVPQKIVRLARLKDSTYDTLFIEDIKYDQNRIGLVYHNLLEGGEPSEYRFYYDSLGKIDLVDIRVLDNDAAQRYASYGYGNYFRPDTLIFNDDTIADSVEIHAIERKVAMIPGYPLKKNRKTETYIRLGDSTESVKTVTTDLYRWISSSQSSGYYYHAAIEKKIIEDQRVVRVSFPPKGGDTLFVDCRLSSEGDTLSERATLLKQDGNRLEKYRVECTYNGATTEKKVEVFDTLIQDWRDSITYTQKWLDGGFAVEVRRYDSLSQGLKLYSREVHKTLLNPEIAYYTYDTTGDSLALKAEDFIIYDSTIVSILSKGISTDEKGHWTIGAKEIRFHGTNKSIAGSIHTLTGKVLRRLSSVSHSGEHRFSYKHLPQGVYVLQLSADGKTYETLFRVR